MFWVSSFEFRVSSFEFRALGLTSLRAALFGCLPNSELGTRNPKLGIYKLLCCFQLARCDPVEFFPCIIAGDGDLFFIG